MPLTDEQAREVVRRGLAEGISEDRLIETLRAEGYGANPAVPIEPQPVPEAFSGAPFGQPFQEQSKLLSQATALTPLSARQKFMGDVKEGARRIGAPLAEVGLPLATAFLTRGTGPIAASLLQAGAAGIGNLTGQAIRRPGQAPSLEEAALPFFLSGVGTAATAGLGHGLTRAGGAGPTATREVMQRGTVRGAQLAFNKLPAEAESVTLDAMRRFLQKPPVSRGGQAAQRIIQQAKSRGLTINVKSTVDRLRQAVGATDPQGQPLTVGPDKLAAQRKLNVLAGRLEQEAGQGGTLPVDRFNQIVSKEMTLPVVKAGGKIEPRLQDTAYIDALRKVKNETIDDLASQLGSQRENFLRARLAARREITAMENLRRRLFTRDKAGNLQPRGSSIPTIRSIFLRAEAGDDTLLRAFQEFDDVTGAGVVPKLREMSLKRELTGADKQSLALVDGVVRSIVGLRSGAAEIARSASRTAGKTLQVGSRPIGAGLGIAGQKVVEQPFEEDVPGGQ